MMITISYLIIALNIGLAIIGLPVYIHRIKRTDFVYSKWEFWLFEIFCVFFSLLHLGIIHSEQHYSDVGLLATVIGCIGIITWFHHVIQFDETGFWILNILWKKKRYEYKDVLFVKRKKREYRKPRRTEHTTTIHLPNKKITVNREYENYYEFMEMMAKNYKKLHGHKLVSK